MKKIYLYEIAQVLVYLSAYNYFYSTAQHPFIWFNYMYVFMPVLVFSGPNYCLYFLARNLLHLWISNKYIAAAAVFLAYAVIAFLVFLFVSRALANNGEVVTRSLSEASLYAPLFLLPFLVLECIFEKLGDPRLL